MNRGVIRTAPVRKRSTAVSAALTHPLPDGRGTVHTAPSNGVCRSTSVFSQCEFARAKARGSVYRFGKLSALSLFALVLACQEPPPTPTDVAPTSSPTPAVKVPAPQDLPETPVRVLISILVDDSGRWLSVVAVKEGAAGAWATGSFKAKRNRLDIRTEDVETFALDTSRIPIRWDKPVVMNINGRTGELRRRDYALLSFALDGRGEWVVVEP